MVQGNQHCRILLEIIHYEVEDKYVIMSAERKKNELMGKSLRYLLNIYQDKKRTDRMA